MIHVKSDRLEEMKRRCEGKLVKVGDYNIGICVEVQTYADYQTAAGSVYNGRDPIYQNLVLVIDDGQVWWLWDDVTIWGE
jgi:hypothetical protein